MSILLMECLDFGRLLDVFAFPVFTKVSRLGFRYRKIEGKDLVIRITSTQQSCLVPELATRKENWYITRGNSDFDSFLNMHSDSGGCLCFPS